MVGEAFEEIREFCAQRDQYWANALEYAAKKELRKASEMAWGAVVQALKAVAAFLGLHLGTHRQLQDFARELSRQTGDPFFKAEFRDLNILHVNFYDGILDEADFPEYLGRAERLIRRLAELLPKGICCPACGRFISEENIVHFPGDKFGAHCPECGSFIDGSKIWP